MKRHQNTLVAMCGGESDRALVSYARLLGSLGLTRRFSFVHVRTPANQGLDLRNDSEVLDSCEALVSNVFSSDRSEVTYGCHVVAGVRVDSLIEFAAQNACDTILLGHRRNRSGQRSLARRLAMIAPCSVWLVPEDAPLTLSNIMVPVDFSDHSADSVAVGAAIARAAGLKECVATHVFSNASMIRYDELLDEIRKNEQEAFQKFMEPIDTQGVKVEPYFLEGNNVARTLLHAAQQQQTDLIVMNTRGRSRAASILLGSVTTQVMVESPVAVFAVKHFGAMLNLFEALQQAQIWKRPTPKTN